MINIKELERRWYKYKAKNVILFFVLLLLVAALVYGGLYLYRYFTAIEHETITLPQKSENMIQAHGTIIPKETVENNQSDLNIAPPVEDNSDEMILSPTIPIVDMDSEKANDRERKRQAAAQSQKKLIKAKSSATLTRQELDVIHGRDLKHEKKVIQFETNTQNYFEVMEQKFAQNKNPREALLLAKAYYDQGDYNSAEQWALKANQLDSKIDESWLVFAQSKVMLGKNQEAINILSSYYKSTKSPKAKALLEKIRTKEN